MEIWWDITREEDYSPQDYSLAGAWDIIIPSLRRPAFNNIWLIDQWITEYTQWACVPINCYLASCHTFNFKPDWDYFIQLLKDLERDWLRKPWVWASIPKVMDYVRKRWNKDFPNNKIKYYRDQYNDAVIKEALGKWYRIVLRYWVTTAYSKDRDDNLVIDKTSYPEVEKYGHIVSMFFSPAIKNRKIQAYHPDKWIKEMKMPDKWDGLYIFDQYPFKRPNSDIYQINTLKELIKNWVYSPWAYTITKL